MQDNLERKKERKEFSRRLNIRSEMECSSVSMRLARIKTLGVENQNNRC
jgi:hypothetical protein